LKQTEKECVVLRKKNKELTSEVGILERSIKEKDEIISRNKKEIKELSKNALNLSKKVITTDDLFINQEEKWLMRERELLEKNMNCLKIKEQFEEGWKREKHTLQIKE
jgi:predicted rRNA methylase YqxC with S4 and FtsJ domains